MSDPPQKTGCPRSQDRGLGRPASRVIALLRLWILSMRNHGATSQRPDLHESYRTAEPRRENGYAAHDAAN